MSSAASEPSRLPARIVAAFRDHTHHEQGRNLHIKTPQSDLSSTTAEGALIDVTSSTNDPLTPDMTSPLSPIQSPASHTSAAANGWSPGSHIITGRVLKEAARGVLELDAIPQADLLKIMAMLLEQIAASNDALRESSVDPEPGSALVNPRAEKNTRSDDGGRAPSPSSSIGTPGSSTSGSSGHKSPTQRTRPVSSTPVWDHLTSASRVALSSRNAALSFHARHIPQISLESYLLRILKYCPTSNTTFVAVLVYFDRMCKIAASIEAERALMAEGPASPKSEEGVLHSPRKRNAEGLVKTTPNSQPLGFTIDSYNIHRLVIAGVTVASKFFSDVFYTNSRYAKVSQCSSQSETPSDLTYGYYFQVGGLPLPELNQLELQFLLLNDFALVVPPEELSRYATQLVGYAQNKNIDLAARDLGKGKMSRRARIVLGLQEEDPAPEPPTLPPPQRPNGHPAHHEHTIPRGYGDPSAWSGRHVLHGSDGMDVTPAPDSEAETELSTDDEPTIRAGSETASESSFGTRAQSTDDDNSDTEGEEEDSELGYRPSGAHLRRR